ncbi:MAG: co-chaperone GroES [Gemmatimonadetes bacterium]|nr:co-chaperone GroES family protein [Gemmatimonadota bacterium]MYB57315.1 co-chaperone GroES [Gemmatimonadota bacterium]MYC15217.1 co-chaperone GroES [Gemmatimonadota bacterium]MYK54204.1 co-chaperone GroES [Gemmatimonadota bacterium]
MQIGNKELVVIGDRVLVKREDLEERTKVGLYLPQTVVEKEEVQSGRIMATGPGLPLPETPEDDEPWRNSPKEPRYLPLQVEEGDFALFLQKAAMEISFEGEKYLIVPQASILVVIRESDTIVGEDEVLDELEGLDDLDL